MEIGTIVANHHLIKLESFKTASYILLGALYVALLSQIEIPIQPVPVTMQTFAVLTLGLAQGGRKACLSIFLYLAAATVGVPVLAGLSSDPLWMIGPSGGFLASFPLAAYFAGLGKEMKTPASPLWIGIRLCLAQSIIFLFGVAWLSVLFGTEQALVFGLYPFLFFDMVKLLGVFSAAMAARSLMRL